jgi:hypothetical protein
MFYVLIALVAASRFLPHPPNVACVGALGLFAGCYAPGRRAFLVPIAALFVSDAIGAWMNVPGIGFYNFTTMVMVYAAVLATVPIGRWMQQQSTHWRLPVGSLAASTAFFVLSNFGVWLGGWYAMTIGGLMSCYINAIPFFGYTLSGDLLFTLLLFGTYELGAYKWAGVLSPNAERSCVAGIQRCAPVDPSLRHHPRC